ncbi:putative leader peptide [Streptomyces sp. NPDC049949]|uniref:putative leader peptide n=1 Tax=Streptomyces sp. NPDC049949 TaxID=3154627 RepID=UPI00342C011E
MTGSAAGPAAASPLGSPAGATARVRTGTPVHAPARRVTRLASVRCGLTVYTGDRQAGGMRYELLLYGRVHVDLVRYASARCRGH